MQEDIISRAIDIYLGALNSEPANGMRYFSFLPMRQRSWIWKWDSIFRVAGTWEDHG